MQRKTRGFVLLMVLGAVLLTAVLAAVILSIVANQSRLNHHQISRIQAYYAALGAVKMAYQQQAKGEWIPSPDDPNGTNTINICRSLPCASPNFLDATLPASINSIQLQIKGLGSGINTNGPTREISATVDYAYVNP